MFDMWRKPKFDSDTLSSIWVMACRDESPILTAFSVAFRLRGITPDEVLELVKSRQELFRLGLTRGQSRGWKARYQQAAPSAAGAAGGKARQGGDDTTEICPARLAAGVRRRGPRGRTGAGARLAG